MNTYLSDPNTRRGTIGGTLLAFFCSVDGVHLAETAITAATAAIASFVVSVLCKRIATWWAGKKRRTIKPPGHP